MAIGYDELSFNEKKYYDKIYRAILNGEGSINLFGLFRMETLEKIIVALKYDHTEFFYVDFQQINCAIAPAGMIYYIHYTIRLSVRDMMNRNMESWIKTAINQMQLTGDETEAEIYKKVHNYIIRNIEYDYDALKNPDMYPEAFTVRGIFERKKAVCEGISKAFKLLCDRVGAKDVYVVEGISSREGFGNSIPHAWNIVKSGNKYSHIDVTWDLGSSSTCRYNRYDYFMIPDDWINIDHTYTKRFKCEEIDQSYFSRQSCLISGSNALKDYLNQKLQKNFSILYFKIVGKNGLPNDIDNKVDNIVQNAIRQYARRTYTIEMMPNREQNIYFYKII